jgi:hypothetical protein
VPRYLLDADGVLSLDLPGGAAENAYVIELWYVFAAGRPATGSMLLTPPKLEVAGEAQRSYWQLVLPPSEHLLAGPNNLAPDMRWRWEQTHFGRAGRFSQAELEQWIGASIQAELPNSANTYLYSSFGSLAPIELRTAARRSVLLACSGALLVAGLVLLYLPLARHPLVLLAGGIGIAAVGLSNPDAAVVAAQAALAGLGCLLLAKLLKSLYGRAPATFTVTRSPAPSHHDAKSTEPHALRAEPLSQATTAVAVTPVAVGETPP